MIQQGDIVTQAGRARERAPAGIKKAEDRLHAMPREPDDDEPESDEIDGGES